MVTPEIESYIELRRSLGYAFKNGAYFLRSYGRFADQRGDDYVRSSTVMAWCRETSSVRVCHDRLQAVIRFARHARAEDLRHEVPPDFIHYRKERPIPYIFTPQQVGCLVAQARRLGPAGSLRPHAYGCLIALLAATGLRISEALRLRLQDVTPDGLVICQAKFRKARLVPLHPTVEAGLERYLVHRRRAASSDHHLFLNHLGKPVGYASAHRVFNQLLRALNLHRTRDPKPRLHALRHTFAVRALLRCPQAREQVAEHLLALCTYMGHSRVTGTYWYLESTPELMNDISLAREAILTGGR
jgi:site-specific recombinase XerD